MASAVAPPSIDALPAPASRLAVGERLARVSPWLAGGVAAIVTGLGSWSPSFWGDEAASVMSAQRPLASLVAELSRIDAVHGLYYLFLHVWIRVVGDSEFAVRLPSVLAAGLAVTATVLIGRELFGRAVGLVAGGVLTVLPGFTVLAIDARSYAMTIAAAAGLVLLLLRLARPSGAPRWMWVLYGGGLLAAIWLWVFAAMMIPVHAALLFAQRADRTTWRRWMRAMAVVVPGMVPIAVVTFLQRHQVAFLAHRDYLTWQNVVIHQWFGGLLPGLLCWALIAVAVVVALRQPTRRRPLLVVVAWMLVPTLLLAGASALVTPIYDSRYTALSLPAVALVVAVGGTALTRAVAPRRWIRAIAALVLASALAVAVAPGYLAQRGPYGFGADFRQVSQVIAAHAAPGDAVVFDDAVKPSWRPRVALHLYPAAFARTVDVALETPFTENPGLWDTARPLSEVDVSAYPVVWAVEVHGSASTDLHVLESRGYRVTDTYPVHRTDVYRLEKDPR